MDTPNIFNYATSELSQDALICYLIEWADKKYKTTNAILHSLALTFLDSLFAKFPNIDKQNIKYDTIEIQKQYENIDILCIIDDKFILLIEDKVDTKNHSNQLKRYLKKAKKDFANYEVLPIYFKTKDQSNYKDIEKDSYQIYTRGNFLQILNSQEYVDTILTNYRDYLQNIDNQIQSWENLPINKWTLNSWEGFFIRLQSELKDGGWGYVPNPSGGFLGFWWNWNTIDNYDIYLQIEYKDINDYKLVFKLYSNTDEKINKQTINIWKQNIEYEQDDIQITKPKIFRRGKTSTIGVLNNDFRKINDDNTINIDRTIEFIQKIQVIKLKLTQKIN